MGFQAPGISEMNSRSTPPCTGDGTDAAAARARATARAAAQVAMASGEGASSPASPAKRARLPEHSPPAAAGGLGNRALHALPQALADFATEFPSVCIATI
eukprot:COSAG02_NODE_34448_length_484_cov_0.672727_1_plen_101_part_01